MIKVEVIEKFTLNDFDKLKNIERKSKEEKGTLFVGDTFECEENMAKYLTGENKLNKAVVKVLEVQPEQEEAEEVLIYCGDEQTPPQYAETEVKPKKKKNKKK